MIIMKYTYTYTGYTAVTKMDKYKDIHIIRLSIFYWKIKVHDIDID